MSIEVQISGIASLLTDEKVAQAEGTCIDRYGRTQPLLDDKISLAKKVIKREKTKKQDRQYLATRAWLPA